MNMTGIIFGQAEVSAAQTFFEQFFVSGGPIVWFVLLPMSVVTVYLSIDLLIATRRKRLLPAGVSTEIATQVARYGLGSLGTKLAGRQDLISRSLLKAVDQGRAAGATADSAKQQAAESLQERGMQLLRKAQWCQLIGSVAPMVGLFGTVYGMICAFNMLGQGSEGPRYEMLAESISVALVTTFWGLLVAIPAQFLYGVFQTRIESTVAEAAMELDLLVGRLYETIAMPAVAQAEIPAAATIVDENEAAAVSAKLVRQGTFLRRKQRRMGVIVQRPTMKRRLEDQTPN
jgi:biopolymer transport protein ExbB